MFRERGKHAVESGWACLVGPHSLYRPSKTAFSPCRTLPGHLGPPRRSRRGWGRRARTILGDEPQISAVPTACHEIAGRTLQKAHRRSITEDDAEIRSRSPTVRVVG